MKKAIIIIISLLVILVGAGVVLWFFTPLFDFLKPARDNFSIQAKKLFGAKTEVSYNDYLKSIESLKGEDSKSFVMKSNISANITLPSNLLDYTNQRRINNTTIKFENSYDADSKATAANFNMQYSGNDVLNFKMVKDGNKMTISSKDFYDKAVTMDMSKFRTFCKNNNIQITDEEISQIENMANNNGSEQAVNMIYELMYLTEDEYNTLHKNYGDILKKYINKDNYTTKKNQKITVNGDDVKATGYSLTISGKDAYNIIKNIAEDAKSDNNLKSIVAKKLNILKKYSGSVAEMGSNSTRLDDVLPNEFSESDIEKYIDYNIEALESAEDVFSSLKRSVKITIYADKKGNPVKLDIAIVKNKDDDGNVIMSGEYSDKKNTYTLDIQNIIKVASSLSEREISTDSMPIEKVVIVDEIKEKSDTAKKGKMKVSIKAKGSKMEVAQIDYELVSSKSEIKRNISVSLSDNVASLVGSSAKFDIKSEITGLDSDNVSMVFNLDAALGSYRANIKADSTIEYGRSNIETFNETNSVDLFSKSKEEVQKIITDIVTKASDVLPTRLSYYGINVTKQKIMDIIPKPETPTVPETPATTDGTTQTPAEPAA